MYISINLTWKGFSSQLIHNEKQKKKQKKNHNISKYFVRRIFLIGKKVSGKIWFSLIYDTTSKLSLSKPADKCCSHLQNRFESEAKILLRVEALPAADPSRGPCYRMMVLFILWSCYLYSSVDEILMSDSSNWNPLQVLFGWYFSKKENEFGFLSNFNVFSKIFKNKCSIFTWTKTNTETFQGSCPAN